MREILENRPWLIARAVVVAVATCLFWLVYVPMLTGSLDRYRKTELVRQKIEEARTWKQVTRRLKQLNVKLQGRLAELTQLMPGQDVQSGTVGLLQNAVRHSGLQLRGLRPADDKASHEYEERGFKLDLSGRYHEVGAFLSWLENANDVVQVRALELANPSLTGANLEISVLLAVFQFADEDATKSE